MQQNIADLRNNILALNTHLGSSLSCLEIIATLYTQDIMRYSVDNPRWDDRDRFILSKGHAGPALYVVLAALGFFRSIGGNTEVLRTMGRDGAVVGRHPDNIMIPGIDCTSGALGEGLGVAAGMALGLKRRGSEARVYVLVGDGESDLGPIWEAADFITKNKLDNIIVSIDMNGLSYCNPVNNNAMAAKWQGFGWDVSAADGHDVGDLTRAYKSIKPNTGKPHVILAHTEKGHGSATAGTIQSHSFTLEDESLPQLKDIDLSAYHPHLETTTPLAQTTASCRIPDMGLSDGAAATRDVGYALEHWVSENPHILPICPDVEESTRITDKTNFVRMGIKEATSVSVAAGLASVGFIPVVSMFDDFLLGTLREIKNTVVVPKLPVLLMTTHSGVGLGKDGASHHSMTAPAAIATFEEITYFEPADLREASHLLGYALQHPDHPYYIRLTRQPLENICPFDDAQETEWIHKGAYRVNTGEYDATLIATGQLVNTARDVAAKLERRGIRLNIVNCFSPSMFSRLTPIERHAVADSAKPIFTAIDAHPSVLAPFANLHGESYGVEHTTPGGGDAPYFYKTNQLDASTLALKVENRCRLQKGGTPLSAQDAVIRECRNILTYKRKCVLFIDGPTRAGTTTFGKKMQGYFEAEGIHVSSVLDSDFFLLSREARDVLKQFAYKSWLNNMNWFSWKRLAQTLHQYTQNDELITLDNVYIHDQTKKQTLAPITTSSNVPNVLIVEGPFIVNDDIRHYADFIVHLETDSSERLRRMLDAKNLASRNRTTSEQTELNTLIYEPSRLLYESYARTYFDMEINNNEPDAKEVIYITDAPEPDHIPVTAQKAIAQRRPRKKTSKISS
ncbi:MAG TPA: hypothetical protein VFT53_03385 [Candidatus Saccharimonadales bacterium]|nr:hypothetical protein [Candidatus Saccharimonadales bacterium]